MGRNLVVSKMGKKNFQEGGRSHFRNKADSAGSYRVSHNIVSTFVLLNSRPPKHLEVPSWTFFNSPFCVDFKTIQFVMICPSLDQDIAKILKGSHFKNQHFCLLLNQELNHSRKPRISQDYS